MQLPRPAISSLNVGTMALGNVLDSRSQCTDFACCSRIGLGKSLRSRSDDKSKRAP